MTRILTAAAAALLLASLAGPLAAQTTLDQTTTVPATTAGAEPKPAPITNMDRQFLIKDAQGGAYEIAIAALAQQRTSREDIRAYASRIIADHAIYNQALQELAGAKGVELPTDMTAEDRVRLNGINVYSGGTADRSFIEEAIRINAEDKQDAADEAAKTPDPDIRAFLRKFEAVDAEHERMALALRR